MFWRFWKLSNRYKYSKASVSFKKRLPLQQSLKCCYYFLNLYLKNSRDIFKIFGKDLIGFWNNFLVVLESFKALQIFKDCVWLCRKNAQGGKYWCIRRHLLNSFFGNDPIFSPKTVLVIWWCNLLQYFIGFLLLLAVFVKVLYPVKYRYYILRFILGIRSLINYGNFFFFSK